MRKKIMGIILTASLLIASVAAAVSANDETLSITTLDNKSALPETSAVYTINSKLSDEFSKIAQSTTHELYLNEKTLGIQVKDKLSGFVYSSAGEDSEGLNQTWTNFMYSGITLEYMNDKQKVIRKPITISNAKIELTKKENGFTANILYEEENIALILDVVLEEDEVIAAIPKESIKELGSMKLQNIYLYPFLGATKGIENDGYFFVPDGSGALIRTNQKELMTSSPYTKRIYGSDYGMLDFNALAENNMLKEPEQIYLPIYGNILQPQQQGFAVVIEEGEEYADIEAYVNGISTPYNFITSKFVFRQTYKQPVDQKGTVMLANQSNRNEMDIKVRYHFLSGKNADYTGIAKYYQNYLAEKGILSSLEDKEKNIPEKSVLEENTLEKSILEKNIPMKVEFVASELEKKLIGHSTLVMTTVEEMEEFLNDLRENGIERFKVVVRGYGLDGATGSKPSEIKLSKKVGNKSEWNEFITDVKEAGDEIEFYVDVSIGYETGGSYSEGKDVVQGINKDLIFNYYYGDYQYLGSHFIQKQLISQGKKAKDLGLNGIAIDSSGYHLFSNWNKKNLTTRSRAKEQLVQAEVDGLKFSYYRPNAYLLSKTNAVYDIPMSSSQYMIFTDTVPFMQMVLKGYIPYYASASNFNADTTNDLLKKIEYGAYPSYYLTNKDSIELYNTSSAWLFTSEYSVWKDQMIEEYNILNRVLSKVEGASIIRHSVPASNVMKVEYSNGVTILINYNETAVLIDGKTIEGKDFAVITK